MSLKKSLLSKICNHINDIKYLKILDVTHTHANHLPKDTYETHFEVIIISDSFCDLSKIARHRILYKLLSTELTSKIHALSLSLYTVNEYSPV